MFEYLVRFQFRGKKAKPNTKPKKPHKINFGKRRKELLSPFDKDSDYIFGKNIITKILFNDVFNHF